jgi:hypothetical protein
LGRLGDMKADGGVQGDAGNKDVLALENAHRFVLSVLYVNGLLSMGSMSVDSMSVGFMSVGSMSVAHPHAAVDRDHRTGDVAGRVADEELDSPRNVVDRAESAEGDLLGILLDQIIA